MRIIMRVCLRTGRQYICYTLVFFSTYRIILLFARFPSIFFFHPLSTAHRRDNKNMCTHELLNVITGFATIIARERRTMRTVRTIIWCFFFILRLAAGGRKRRIFSSPRPPSYHTRESPCPRTCGAVLLTHRESVTTVVLFGRGRKRSARRRRQRPVR